MLNKKMVKEDEIEIIKTSDVDDAMSSLHKELDQAVQQTVQGDDIESDLYLEDVAPKINRICDDIRNTINMSRHGIDNCPSPAPMSQNSTQIGDDNYFEYADVEASIINLLKEQVKALKNIIDRI